MCVSMNSENEHPKFTSEGVTILHRWEKGVEWYSCEISAVGESLGSSTPVTLSLTAYNGGPSLHALMRGSLVYVNIVANDLVHRVVC